MDRRRRIGYPWIALPLMAALIALAAARSLRQGSWRPAWAARPAAPLSGDFFFAVVGDSGTGSQDERDVAARMIRLHDTTPFGLVLMLGDNVYPQRCGGRPFQTCFEEPFRGLLDLGVTFRAVIGNHDEAAADLVYPAFHMDGRRHYTFGGGAGLAQFFALDSEQMDAGQLAWLERELSASRAVWKIAFFHKPIYNAGRQHGPDLPLRQAVEPLFARYDVSAVFSGHEHVYERLLPQRGVAYFVSGSAGHVYHELDRSDPALAAGDDRSCGFMIVALTPREMRCRAIDSRGEIVDEAVIAARAAPATGR